MGFFALRKCSFYLIMRFTGIDTGRESPDTLSMSESNYWRKCSFCKVEIPYASGYYRCSVSSCNQRSTDYVFCSVHCFETHVPGARHKDAAAVHEKSPFKVKIPEIDRQPNNTPVIKGFEETTNQVALKGQRRIVVAKQDHTAAHRKAIPKDILIVASKLKDYIRNVSEFNTSADVMHALSEIVRTDCLKAIERARADGRKTVMARDFTRTK
jgi:histone H3/H4